MRSKSLAALGALAAFAVSAPAASAAPNANNSQKLRDAVSVESIREHMAAFQAIADASGGNRLAGAPGHEASAQYVTGKLQAAGYTVASQPFDYQFTGNRTPPVLSVVGGPSYVNGFQIVAPGSLAPADSGDVTAPLYAVDLGLPAATGNTSGCQAADFAGFPVGAIALMRRGQCDFVVKIGNAIAAGARAVVLMNEGNDATAARQGLFNPATTGDLPVLATTFPVGVELANGVANGPTGRTVRVKLDIISQRLPTRNLIAQTSGREDNVIVVGAHLDGVEDGPGVNDDGSGSATTLDIAEAMSKTKPRNAVRFVFFSAEEAGLLGSEFYVNSRSAAQRSDIAAMLDFDMLASPNFARFVYDGDLSTFPGPPGTTVPTGSAAIEKIFNDYFAAQGMATLPTRFDGRSDYRDFIEAGIPAGGIFAGAEVPKTPEQVALFGGVAGEQYDPCYHAFCDSLSTFDGAPPALALANPLNAAALQGNAMVSLDQFSDAAAHSVITLAQSTEMLNGERGKGNFNTDAKVQDQATR